MAKTLRFPAPPAAATSEKEEIPDNILSAYLRDIGRYALLTPADEIRLAKRIRRGDKAAYKQMVAANLRLVVKIAGDYRDRGLALHDLIAEGNLGLMKAVERFDPAKGGKLSTYAVWWIKQSIGHAVATQTRNIRLTKSALGSIFLIKRHRATLEDRLGRTPSLKEISQSTGIPEIKIASLLEVADQTISLDAPIGVDEGSSNLGELIADNQADTPLQALMKSAMKDDVNALLQQLGKRDATIMRLRFGLTGKRPMTLERIASRYKVTRERIRQIEFFSLRKLREWISALDEKKRLEMLLAS